MIAPEIQWLEDKLTSHHDGIVAAFREHLSKAEAAFAAEIKTLRERQSTLTAAVHALLTRDSAMSDLTDAIRSEIASVSSDIDELIAQKREDDSAALTAIKGDMDALKTKVAAALVPASQGQGASGSNGTAASGANTSTSAPTTSVGFDTTTATTQDGNVTTVDHATGSASTVDASGTPVATDEAAAQAAKDAASLQGVTIPSA